MNTLNFLKPLPLKDKIRLGHNADGGYVVYKKALSQADVLITYGVGWEVSFEEHFNQLTNKPVFMFDPHMFGEYMVDLKKLGKLLRNMRFATAFGYLHFIWDAWRKRSALTKRSIYFINEGISSVKFEKHDTFAAHISRFGLQGKRILLKMDIEGYEYNVFGQPGIFESLNTVDQLVLEMHDLKNKLRDARRILQALYADFELVHIHGNNCGECFVLYGGTESPDNDVVFPDTIEITLVRRGLIHASDILSESMVYPITALDFPNNPGKKDYVLAFT